MNDNDSSTSPASDAPECPECGAPLPADAPGGLCPRCLLESATAAPSDGPSQAAIITARARPQPGAPFGGYQIVRQLGRGGMGEVWEAEHLESGRRVALKVLGQALDSADARGRFLREGRLAASVNHPNSVYVFGTEEIDGTPVIAMELVSGGTLQDRVREHGPLPVTEAVDIILQIIAGLEAAQSIGILHRDIKPSNCFVEPDGSVKVGDFGLSIATTGRAETNITLAGSILGTPAFSSPEQLRGDELTVRSDIYSVGVTLYHLLTGRTPFEADNFVKLLSRVIEEQPPSPLQHRRDIPKDLARLILRCLAKQPSERFRDYAELRAALFPFSSTAPTPATLGLRFGAGTLDLMFVSFANTAATLLIHGDFASLATPGLLAGSHLLATIVGAFGNHLLYFGLCESLFGATPGKALLRLRVQDAHRQRPHLARALLRASLYTILPQVGFWWHYWQTAFSADGAANAWSSWAPFSYYVGLLVLFCTARRRNGFAGIHELLSGTRVVARTAFQERPQLLLPTEPEPPTDTAAMIGPYHDLGPIGPTSDCAWRLGYDTKLLRKVWLHLRNSDALPVPVRQKALNRVGRLRWLNARRPDATDSGPAWDAYEGLGGKPLLELAAQPQPWVTVRHWALDLAEELAASAKDRSTPAILSLDRVWITDGGRAKLLDFAAPGLASDEPIETAEARTPPPVPTASSAAACRFLHEVITTALHGLGATTEAGAPPTNPQPIPVRTLLEDLTCGNALDEVVAKLRTLTQRVARITRARRLAMVAACLTVPLLTVLSQQLSRGVLDSWREQSPEITEISTLLNIRAGQQLTRRITNQSGDDDQVGIYIAHHHRETVTNSELWNSTLARLLITGEKRSYAEAAVTNFANPTPEEIEQAEKSLRPMLQATREGPLGKTHNTTAMVAVSSLIFYVGLPALIAALLFRGGLVQRAAGVVLVNRRGETASRLRTFWRALIIWAPPSITALLFAIPETVVPIWIAPLFAVVLITIIGWSLSLRERGIPDRLSGIWPVPR